MVLCVRCQMQRREDYGSMYQKLLQFLCMFACQMGSRSKWECACTWVVVCASVSMLHFLSADLQQVSSLSPWPTGYLHFMKASLGSHHLWCCTYSFCLSAGDVETDSHFLQNDQSKTGHIHKFKDSCCKSALSITKSQHRNSSPLSHKDPMIWFSETLHKAAKKLLDLQVSIWTFCKGFSPS